MSYQFVYLFMNVGAFLVVIAVYDSEGSFDIAAYNGLYRRNPGLAAAMTVFLLSLIGFPPLAGFMGKLYLFMAVLSRGQVTLAVAAALNSVIALFYYVRIIRAMVIDESSAPEPVVVPALSTALISAMALPTIGLIFLWDHVHDFARAKGGRRLRYRAVVPRSSFLSRVARSAAAMLAAKRKIPVTMYVTATGGKGAPCLAA